MWAGTAPSATSATTPTSDERRPRRAPSWPSSAVEHADHEPAGRDLSRRPRAIWSETCRPSATPKTTTLSIRTTDDAVRARGAHPRGSRRAPVRGRCRRRATARRPPGAGADGRGPTAYAVTPSSSQAWISQAMLSGASSSAPRWSVVGLIGWIAAGSRASSSRPPPEAAAERRASTRKPASAVGSTPAGRSAAAGPRRRPGGTPAPTASRDGQRRGPPTAERGGARRRMVRRGSGAGGRRRRRRGAPGRRAVVGPEPVSRGGRGRHARPPRRASRSAAMVATRAPPRSTLTVLHASTASSRRWVETSTQAPRARASLTTSRVASTPIGSTPSKGSSSSSTARLVQGSEHDAEAAAHAVAEAGGHAVGDVAELEALEQVAGRGPPSRASGAAGRRAAGAPTASRAAPGRRRRGSSRPPA